MGLKSLSTTYQYGATPTTVNLTASIPSTDILGKDRYLQNETVKTNLGATQLSSLSTNIIQMEDVKINIFTNDQIVYINGASGKHIQLFTISGQLIYERKIYSDLHSISTNKNGVFILKIDGYSTKLIVK
jgi:hypothetical protein